MGRLGVGRRRSLVVASGSVQTKGTVGEELADKRVGGEGDGNAVKVLGDWSMCLAVRVWTYARTTPRDWLALNTEERESDEHTDGDQLWGNLLQGADTLGDGVCCDMDR